MRRLDSARGMAGRTVSLDAHQAKQVMDPSRRSRDEVEAFAVIMGANEFK
jgi:hypothetical protein